MADACFQIGDAHLALDSCDGPLTDRFRRLYGDCEVDASSMRDLGVHCRIRHAGAAPDIAVDVRDPEPVDIGLFMETAFGDRGCRRVPGGDDGWQAMTSREPDVAFRIKDRHVLFPADRAWQPLAANLAVALVLRLQQEVIFLHAAGVALGPRQRGVLFIGPKGAGKTTTSLGLAFRGHRFLGDEIVGVRRRQRARPADTPAAEVPAGEMVPVLRTIAKRDGPCTRAVDAALAAVPQPRVRYPDGHDRTLVPASRLFGARASSTLAERPALRAIVFLDGFGDTPALSPVASPLAVASRLTPVTSTLWNRSGAARAFALMALLTSAPSYRLRLGPPDLTLPVIEQAFAS